MIKMSKKFTSLFLTIVFLLSLVPHGVMATDAAEPTVHKLGIKNHVWVYKTTSSVCAYDTMLKASGVKANITSNDSFRSFFQLDFSGYEYLLRDPGTKINMSLTPGGTVFGDYVCTYNLYILPDSDDEYGEHYIPYSDGTYGMKYSDVFDYVKNSVISGNINNYTPFITRGGTELNYSAAQDISSDANMQVLTDALDAGVDNSIVTIQIMHMSGTKANATTFKPKGANTYLMLTPTTNPEATPAKYVADTKTELWSAISSEEAGELRSDLNLINKYKGIDISWSSTNPAAVNAETGVVTRTRAEQVANLTANLSYTDFEGNVTTDSITFGVTLPAITLEEDPVFGDAINTGDTALGFRKGYTATVSRMESVTAQLGGKAPDDAYLSYGDVGGTREIPLANATGNQDTMEFSFYIPSGSGGMSMSVYMRTPDGYDYKNYYLLEDGLYIKYSSSMPKQLSWEADKWHTIAFITPDPYDETSSENDIQMDIYLDGEFASEVGFAESTVGYDSRFNPRLTLLDVTSSAEPPAIYLDNIRVHSDPYAPEYDLPDEILYTDGIDNDKIIVKGETTVAQLKQGITKKADTAIRVYSAETGLLLSDEDYVSHGDTVVAAAKNNSEMERSYNYYTIDRIKYESITTTKVNGAESNVYDGDDDISVSSVINNYSDDETYNVKMYAAQYKYGELINVWTDNDYTSLAPGQSETLSCDFEGLADRENSTIKVMVLDDKLTPMQLAASMYYRSGNDKATLWLLGDSTVQTYEDKTDDPIQGWGFHIDSYLNDNITVKNMARGGWTTDHYLYPDNVYTKKNGVSTYGETLNISVVDERHRACIWENIKNEIVPGDFVILNLGINDSSAVGDGVYKVPKERFIENIETIYTEGAKLGATVILATPVPSGGSWNSAEFLYPGGRKAFATYMTNTAAKLGAVCIPFGATVYDTYLDMVDEYLASNEGATKTDAYNYVKNYFHLYTTSGTAPEGYTYAGGYGDDSTHHNTVGSKQLAKILSELIAESVSPLGGYVVSGE